MKNANNVTIVNFLARNGVIDAKQAISWNNEHPASGRNFRKKYRGVSVENLSRDPDNALWLLIRSESGRQPSAAKRASGEVAGFWFENHLTPDPKKACKISPGRCTKEERRELIRLLEQKPAVCS